VGETEVKRFAGWNCDTSKNIPKELAVQQKGNLKWPKLRIIINSNFEQNITLLFLFTVCNSFVRELLSV
jgi:hypothetical protein